MGEAHALPDQALTSFEGPRPERRGSSGGDSPPPPKYWLCLGGSLQSQSKSTWHLPPKHRWRRKIENEEACLNTQYNTNGAHFVKQCSEKIDFWHTCVSKTLVSFTPNWQLRLLAMTRQLWMICAKNRMYTDVKTIGVARQDSLSGPTAYLQDVFIPQNLG